MNYRQKGKQGWCDTMLVVLCINLCLIIYQNYLRTHFAPRPLRSKFLGISNGKRPGLVGNVWTYVLSSQFPAQYPTVRNVMYWVPR